MSETLPEYHTAVNQAPIIAILTDGEYALDYQVIHPDDLPKLNERAQTETEGELYWLPIDPIRDTRPLFEVVIAAMTPLQTVSTLLDLCGDEVGENLHTIKRQMQRISLTLQLARHWLRPRGWKPNGGHMPVLYYQLGGGVESEPQYNRFTFNTLPRALAFQEKYPCLWSQISLDSYLCVREEIEWYEQEKTAS